MVASRAAVRSLRPCRVATPLSPAGTEEGLGRGGGFRVELYGEDPEASPPPGDGHTVYYPIDVDDVPVAWGSRPDPSARRVWTAGAGSAAHRGPDSRRRFSDARCSCAADGRTGRPPFLRYAASCLPSRLSTCPRSSSRISLRDACVASSWWKHLVEVPTILYFLEQKVDIPVPGGGGRHADLQGFLSGQSRSSLTFQFTVEVFKVLPQERIRQRHLL